MPTASTPSGDLFSHAWAMCPHPERSLRFLVWRSLCVGPSARESKKSCWRKPQTHSRSRPAAGRIRRSEMSIAIAMIVFCWIVSFFFNGIESGLLSIDPVRLRQNVKHRVPAALRLDRLLKHPERLLVTVLLVTNAADILGLLLLTRELVGACGYAGFFFSLAIALPVYLFFLSVLPKSLFRWFPFRALARLAGVLELVSILFSPLLEFGARLTKLLLPARTKKRARLFAGREELKQITTESERQGTLSPTERAMIHSVVDFRSIKVRDVMLRLAKVVTLPAGASTQEAIELSASSGLDRFPVGPRHGQPAGSVTALHLPPHQTGK